MELSARRGPELATSIPRMLSGVQGLSVGDRESP
jgi:hypothetical protein